MAYQCIKDSDCFDDWFGQLVTVAARQNYELSEIDKPDWQVYYDDRLTPKEALEEDLRNA